MPRAVDPGPSRKSYDITPHATDPLPVGRGIFVGVAGDVTGRLIEDTADSTWTFAAGEHPLAFQYVRVTGTTASQLKVLF